MANKVYVGDVGTVILLDTGEDLTSAQNLKIKWTKPNGESGYWDGSQSETTKISYTIQTDDLDIDGEWLLQAYAENVGSAWSGHGLTVTMDVYALFR